MNANQFFLEEYNTLRMIVEELLMNGLRDDQLRQSPGANHNSLAWLLWHSARWEDIAVTMIDQCLQLLDRDHWQARMNLSRCDAGTGMTMGECAEFNHTVNIAGLWAYWHAVGQRTREITSACTQSS